LRQPNELASAPIWRAVERFLALPATGQLPRLRLAYYKFSDEETRAADLRENSVERKS
jgi:hypothetical protein